jgi:hypothetical protein
MKFFDLRDPFLVLVVIFQKGILIGLQGTLYDLLACWESIVWPFNLQQSNLAKFGLIAVFLAFMALGVKFLQLAEFLGQNGPQKAKKL